MRKIILSILVIFSSINLAICQINYFPSSGDAGIGTTTPTTRLVIQANSNDNLISFRNSSAITKGYIGTAVLSGQMVPGSNSNDLIIRSESQKIMFSANAGTTAHMTIAVNGNVGIGTITPTEKLSINEGMGTGYYPLLSLNETTNNGSNSMGIDFKFAGASGFPWGATGRIEVARQLTNSSFDMIFHTAHNGALSEKMRITNSGYIGIGTSTPQATLDVNGNIYSNGKIYLGIPDANTSSQIASYSLAVDGSAIFTKAVVKLKSNWPDYVFERTYHLPKLDSIERFIRMNRHLPEVQSSEEIEKNGIDLGANQALLLKKVEELTLLAIEQNKQTQKLQKIVEEQNKKIQQQSKDIEQLETESKKTKSK